MCPDSIPNIVRFASLIYPSGVVSIRIGKAAGLAGKVFPQNEISWGTIATVEKLAPW
jgi:hypothetical protein